MTILDKIKSFFKRAKPVAEVVKKKAPKATGKKVPSARKRKRAG